MPTVRQWLRRADRRAQREMRAAIARQLRSAARVVASCGHRRRERAQRPPEHDTYGWIVWRRCPDCELEWFEPDEASS
jgi:hypothetical protein